MTKPTGGSAFPSKTMTAMVPSGIPKEWLDKIVYAEQNHNGMTLRQWYAGMALQGLISNQWSTCSKSYPNFDAHVSDLSKCAFNIADALIAEGEK